MSLDISVDTAALSKRMAEMLGKIDHFKRVDLGTGLSDFQTQDMHRNRPFTMRSRARGVAVTKVRPHSLYEMEHSAMATKRIQRYLRSTSKRRRKKAPRFSAHTSTRPILRPQLLSVLQERMTALLAEKITW
jgi:hypothetical protein